MHRSRHLRFAQSGRGARDLLPVAEVEEVALFAAAVGAGAGFGGGMTAVVADEMEGVPGGGRIGQEEVHEKFPTPRFLAHLSTGPVNARFTMAARWLRPDSVTRRNSLAGGAPLALFTLGGLGIGFAQGQPSLGLAIGLALGLATAVTLWLVDRRR